MFHKETKKLISFSSYRHLFYLVQIKVGKNIFKFNFVPSVDLEFNFEKKKKLK